MTNFDADTLRELRDVQEVAIRTEKHPKSAVVIWVVVADDEVTPEGRRLAALYTELDLLAAECLRRGTWAGLPPAELAACVSALTFESRRPDEAAAPRLPPLR